jgi:FixJ family two-component response regulator
MPHMTGWELAKALKSREPKLSTIFITGYSNTVGMWNQTFLNQHGVVALLNKPLDFEYLSCIIEDQIRFRRR